MQVLKIFAILLVLLTAFCGCSQAVSVGTGSSAPDVGADDAPPPKTPSGPENAPYAYVLSPGFDRQEGIAIPDYGFSGESIAFDFGELALEAYPYGRCSVDELEGKYGKASAEATGALIPANRIEVCVFWDDMTVDLRAERNGAMSFDMDSNPMHTSYPLNAQDRAVKIPVYQATDWGDNFPLPRELIIGQSTVEEVKLAYPVAGSEVIDSPALGAHSISYKYIFFDDIATKQKIERSDIGYIEYGFKNNILSTVTIGWEAA